MIRRFGSPPVSGVTYRLRPGAYAVLWREGRLLLTHQDEPEPEFQLPGGGIDPGEHPITALHREVFEETGWHIDRPLRLGAFRRFVFMPEYNLWAEKLCTIYAARPVLCLGAPAEAGHEAHWMMPETALEAVENPGDRYFLAQFLQSKSN